MNEIGTRATLCLGMLNLGVVCGWGGEVTPSLLGSWLWAALRLLSWLGFLLCNIPSMQIVLRLN